MTLCVRCGCHVYTDDDDWEALAKAVAELKGDYGKCDSDGLVDTADSLHAAVPRRAWSAPSLESGMSNEKRHDLLHRGQSDWLSSLRPVMLDIKDASSPKSGKQGAAKGAPGSQLMKAQLKGKEVQMDKRKPNWKEYKGKFTEFGKHTREDLFHLERFFLNSASYGATPHAVLEGRRMCEDAIQANPTYWRLVVLPQKWDNMRTRLAKFLGTQKQWLQVLPNANAASNAVFKSLPWMLGDKVLVFSVEYGASLLACEWLGRTYGVAQETLELTLPMTDDEICDALTKKLKELKGSPGGLPKLVNFCHVTSMTAWIFPAKKITKICHDNGISVMCDGAQAAGHLDFKVDDIGADWYVGTVHKWICSCPGVAFLVTKPHKQQCTFPQAVSSAYGDGYEKEFAFSGVQDWSPWLCVVDALDFVDEVVGGWDKVREYCTAQGKRVAGVCKKVWEAENLKGPSWCTDWPSPVQGEGRHGQMPIIPLPWKGAKEAAGEAGKVMGSLTCEGLTGFTLVIPIGPEKKKTLCIRCACQIYTSDDDWKAMAKVVADFKGEYGALEAMKDLLKMPGGKDRFEGGAVCT